jgi:hypothetical protein
LPLDYSSAGQRCRPGPTFSGRIWLFASWPISARRPTGGLILLKAMLCWVDVDEFLRHSVLVAWPSSAELSAETGFKPDIT